LPPIRFAAAIALVAVFLVHDWGIAAHQSGLKIVVITGEDAVNVIQQKTAVAPVVEVRDRNDIPVPGAVVTFTIAGPGASFGGAQTLTVTTNAAGRAIATGFTPTSSGALQISASAAFQGQTAAVTISQTTFATTQAAAQAGAVVAGGGGGGISGVTIGIIGAAVGGGALAVTQLAGGGESSSAGSTSTSPTTSTTPTTTTPATATTTPTTTTPTTPTPEPTPTAPPGPRSGVYRGSFSGTYSSTVEVIATAPRTCPGSSSVTGELILTVDVRADGSLSGSSQIRSVFQINRIADPGLCGITYMNMTPLVLFFDTINGQYLAPIAVDFSGPISGEATGLLGFSQHIDESVVRTSGPPGFSTNVVFSFTNRRSGEFSVRFDGHGFVGSVVIAHRGTATEPLGFSSRSSGFGSFPVTLRQ
jgi:hypothetical protein